MSISEPLPLPPGFEQLSKEQQIDEEDATFVTLGNLAPVETRGLMVSAKIGIFFPVRLSYSKRCR